MTLTEFLARYNGQYVEAGGTADALNQCTDLVNAYIDEVLGYSKILWTNAVDYPSKAGDQYQYILNTPEGVPQEGDLVIWGGTYGHIAIFLEGDANTFRSFDQNYPLGSPSHVQNHTNYNNVLGWLRKRAIIAQPIAQPSNEQLGQTDIITSIYMGILGKTPSGDELMARLEQLARGIVLHDIVSQVLHEDGRSPLLKVKSDYKGMLIQAEHLAKQFNEELKKVRLLTLSNETLTKEVLEQRHLVKTSDEAYNNLLEEYVGLQKPLEATTAADYSISELLTMFIKKLKF